MDIEKDGHLAFLDIDIYKKEDGSLWHKIYWKPTHRNLYLNAKSHHHLLNKQAILNILVHIARVLCHGDSLQDELEFLKITFTQNGYSDQQIQCALNPTPKTPKSTRSQC